MAITLTKRVNSWLLPICLAATDACWIAILAWIFNFVVLSIARVPHLPSPLILAVLELAAWWLASILLDRTRLSLAPVQILSGLLGLAVSVGVVALAIPARQPLFTIEWLGASSLSILLGLAMWSIGGYRASQGASFDDAYVTFRIGVIAMGAAILFATIVMGARLGALWAILGALPIWFFLWALCSLALGNRETVRQEGGKAGGRAWSLTFVASVVGVLLLGTAVGLLGGASLIDIVAQFAGGLLSVLSLIAFAIFWLVSQIGAWVVLTFFQGGRPSQGTGTPTPSQNLEPFDIRDLVRDPSGLPRLDAWDIIPPEVRDVFIWVAITIAGLGLLWLLNQGLRRTQKTVRRESLEERESLGSWGLLWSQLKSWLARLLRRNSASAPAVAAPEDDLAALRGDPELSGALSVRQIYAHLQSLAARAGYPRSPQQTPIEYLSLLSAAMPDLQVELRDITASYLEVRYGPMPVSRLAVLTAANAWKRAEPTLRSAAQARNSSS